MKIEGIEVTENVTVERVMELAREGMFGTGNPGICLACGEEADGVEPDARKYVCEACGEPAVFGAEELLIHFGI